MSSLKKICLFTLLILTIHNPTAVTAEEKSNDDVALLMTTVPIIAAGVGRKFNDCMEEMGPGCEKTYNYCMLTVQEKISYQLQLCFDKKRECYSACGETYKKCCTASGLPECPPACQIQRTSCMATCDAEGTQCTLDAISGNYDPPIEDECQNDLDECLEHAKELCRGESLSP